MLNAEQMARRAAREALDYECVRLGGGLAAKVRRYLSPSVQVIDNENPGVKVDVEFATAAKICNRGDLIFSAHSNVRTHCDWSTVPDSEVGRIVVVISHTANDKPNIVEHHSQREPMRSPRGKRRIVTDMAVIDITDKGLILREVAPGVSAREVQQVTGTLLMVGADLREIEV